MLSNYEDSEYNFVSLLSFKTSMGAEICCVCRPENDTGFSNQLRSLGTSLEVTCYFQYSGACHEIMTKSTA